METNEIVEMVDVVDEKNNVIGEAPRKGIHKTDKLHRAAHIFMFDSEGRLWIERRGQTVDTNPGFYDSSAAGHVSKGETYDQGAQREALEELGIEGLELKPLHDLQPIPATGSTEFVRLFVTASDEKPRLHEDAASQEKYTIAEIDEKIKRGENFVPTFLRLFKWYKDNVLK